MPDEYLLFLSQATVPKAVTTQEVIEAADGDPIYRQLREAIQAEGTRRHTLWSDPALKLYKNLEPELSLSPDGLILQCRQLLLPASLQRCAVEIAHKGHIGIVKTKQLLRTCNWFPNMDKLVEQAVRDCIPCQSSTPSSQRDPVEPTPLPKAP